MKTRFTEPPMDYPSGTLGCRRCLARSICWNLCKQPSVSTTERINREPDDGHAAMSIIDILLLPLELLEGVERFLSGLDSFRKWRQSESDARIRRTLTNPVRTKPLRP